eukprot:gene12312-biopygen8985
MLQRLLDQQQVGQEQLRAVQEQLRAVQEQLRAVQVEVQVSRELGGGRAGSSIPASASISPPPASAPSGGRGGNRTPPQSPSRMAAKVKARLSAAVRQIPADLNALRGAVADGADVMMRVRVDRTERWNKNLFSDNSLVPVLSVLILRGELEAVLACLESPAAIDFTRTSTRLFNTRCSSTPIHEIVVAKTAGWPEYNRRVLCAVVDRIARHPSDKVDWSTTSRDRMRCKGGLPSLAAEHQLLSVLWPVLQSDVAYFADQTEPISLTEDVWAVDWAALGPTEQRSFNKERARLIDADEATSRLWISCQRYPEPDCATIRECVAAGADVMLKYGYESTPILSHILYKGPMEVVECLLQTPHPIDFTVGSRDGWTPLHYVTWGWFSPAKKTPEEVRRLLRLLLDRIEQHPQQDTVDWGRKSEKGHEPISIAARYGHLAAFAEVVFHERPVPYYTDHPGRIDITYEADRSDVNRLPAADLKRFDFTEGIDEDN